jgi:hypothetical protein
VKGILIPRFRAPETHHQEHKEHKEQKRSQKKKQERFPNESASSFIPYCPDVGRWLRRFCGGFHNAAHTDTADTSTARGKIT